VYELTYYCVSFKIGHRQHIERSERSERSEGFTLSSFSYRSIGVQPSFSYRSIGVHLEWKLTSDLVSTRFMNNRLLSKKQIIGSDPPIIKRRLLLVTIRYRGYYWDCLRYHERLSHYPLTICTRFRSLHQYFPPRQHECWISTLSISHWLYAFVFPIASIRQYSHYSSIVLTHLDIFLNINNCLFLRTCTWRYDRVFNKHL
jgi:hypothetical protein